jgi:hypothetical protein
VHKLARILHKNAGLVNACAGMHARAGGGSGRFVCGQIEQRTIGGASQGTVQPSAEQLAVDLALPDFCEHDCADEYASPGFYFAFSLGVDRPLARVEPLLPKLQLTELFLQCGDLIIEFGHEYPRRAIHAVG